MAICPSCKSTFGRRKDGACPACGVELRRYGGRWYRAEVGSPTVALLEQFERLVSRQASFRRQMPVVFSVPRKTGRYQRELVVAERILELAEGELELSLRAMQLLFEDAKFNWKGYNTLFGVEQDFPEALAVVRARDARRAEEARKEDEAFDKVMGREDIFSDD